MNTFGQGRGYSLLFVHGVWSSYVILPLLKPFWNTFGQGRGYSLLFVHGVWSNYAILPNHGYAGKCSNHG